MESKETVSLKDLTNINFLNYKTILSIIMLIAGILFYISWGVMYGVWADIGIYSITILFVLSGIIGLILIILENKNEK